MNQANVTRFSRKIFVFTISALTAGLSAYAQNSDPTKQPDTDSVPNQFRAFYVKERMVIDGNLNETSWQKATVMPCFIQKYPEQGRAATNDTEVKIMYDSKNLYIGALCKDSFNVYKPRVQSFQRDFDNTQNDAFGIAIDGVNNRQSCLVFQTTPVGNQADMIVYDGDQINPEWDEIWYVKTKQTTTGWYVEMAIPWSALRYPKGSDSFGLILFRVNRRLNEYSSFPAVPRSLSFYRMQYAASIEFVASYLPNKISGQITPYTLFNAEKTENDSRVNIQAGGDAKIVLTPSTTLEGVVNMDFAQAEADKDIINASRFSYFFPEKRKFFQENRNLFSVGWEENIQPLFTRKLGLDDDGRPIPIIGGLRLVNQTKNQKAGAMVLRQKANNATTDFGVVRYTKNYTFNNDNVARLGALVNAQFDHATDTSPARVLTNVSVDGLLRPSPWFTYKGMVSVSKDQNAGQTGIAAYSNLQFTPDWIYANYNVGFSSNQYNTSMGFLNWPNALVNNFELYPIVRAKWLPGIIQSWEPEFFGTIVHDAGNGAFQEARLTIGPAYFVFNDGASVAGRIIPTWTRLYSHFTPFGDKMGIDQGQYSFVRYYLRYISDRSKVFGYQFSYENGKFFDGALQTLSGEISLAPMPNFRFSSDIQWNNVRHLGNSQKPENFYLLRSELRIALNTKIQLSAYFQYNSLSGMLRWNIRGAYEFSPLSFLYIIVNQTPTTSLLSENQQGVLKLNYTYLFGR